MQQLIVTAVLEHEAISGLSSHKQLVGQSGRARYGPGMCAYSSRLKPFSFFIGQAQ